MACNEASNNGDVSMVIHECLLPYGFVKHLRMGVSITNCRPGARSATKPHIFVVRSLLSHCQHPQEREQLVSRLFSVIADVEHPSQHVLDSCKARLTAFVAGRQEAQEVVSRLTASLAIMASIHLGEERTDKEVDRSFAAIAKALCDDCFAVPESAYCVKALKKIKYEGVERDKMCAICFEEFEGGEEVAVTPCSHGFHGRCLREWIGLRAVCPLCRSSIPPPPQVAVHIFL